MFHKLVANLPYSPTLANQVGFYARRLKSEEFTRRLGLMFVIAAVVLQSFISFNPPAPAVAASTNNIIYNGVTSLSDLLSKYDANSDGAEHKDIQQIFNQYGINREDLVKANLATIRSTDHNRQLRSIGRKAYGLTGETAVPIAGTSTTVYERYLWAWDSGPYSTYKVLQGKTTDGRYFAVMLNCGNIIVDTPAPAPANPKGMITNANCDAIQGWAYDPNDTKQYVQVLVYFRLENDQTDFYKTTVTANLPEPSAGIGGNHGFAVTVPTNMKSSAAHTIYSVVALDKTGGGENVDLARMQSIDTYCAKTQPRPQPKTTTPAPCSYDQSLPADSPDCKPAPCQYNTDLTADNPDCLPCPTNDSLWIKDATCKQSFSLVTYSKSAANLTQRIADANNTTAKPGDVIKYTLSATNSGNIDGKAAFSEDLSDVLEYADLVNSNSGNFDKTTGIISWPTVAIAANASMNKIITVKVKKIIPSSPSPTNNPESNNLIMRNVFHNNTIVIKVARPLTKTPEVLAAELPNTGPGANAVISFALVFLAAYFYARNRQLSREIKLVRAEYGYGPGV